MPVSANGRLHKHPTTFAIVNVTTRPTNWSVSLIFMARLRLRQTDSASTTVLGTARLLATVHMRRSSITWTITANHESWIPWARTLQGGPKIGTICLYALTLPNINRFSKLFHCQNQEKIGNNTITKDPITPQVCRYTTLWNVKCLKNNDWEQDDLK